MVGGGCCRPPTKGDLVPKIIPLPACSDSPTATSDAGVSLPSAVAAAIEKAVADFRGILLALAACRIAGPGDLFDLEVELHAQVPKLCLDPVVGAMIREALESEDVLLRAEALLASRQGMRLQKQGQVVRIELRGGGRVSVPTAYFLDRKPRPGPKRRKGQRGRAGNGFYPVLEALGIHERMTPAFGSEVARLVVTHSEEAAQQELRRQGILRNLKSIRRIVRGVAQRALAHRAENRTDSPDQSPLEGKRLGIFVDGGRLRVRLKKRGRKRKSGSKSFQADWKEPKVLVICELDETGRKARRGFLRYEATMGDADALFKLLAAILREVGACDAAQWVVGGDGAKWIWNRYSKLVTELGYDPERVVEVVDFWHAVGYLWEFAGLCAKWTEAKRRDWVQAHKRHLRRNQIDEIITSMRSHCIGRNAKKLKVLANRFATNRERMRYREFKLGGIPRGSGAVESAVRRIVNLRLKGPGIFWLPENAEGMLHLRSQLLSGTWDELMRRIFEPAPFWRRHPARDLLERAA